MKFRKTIMAAAISLAVPASFAQSAPDLPVSPVVSTATMLNGAEEPAYDYEQVELDEYGRPIEPGNPAEETEDPVVEAALMPRAPVSVLSKDVPSAAPLAKNQKVYDVKKITAEEKAPQYNTRPLEIETSYGQTELVNVSVGHPTRIVTPFMQPSVLKIDENAVVSVKQNVVYFASDSQTPVTLHIREEGYEGQSITLTLLPQKIPPREVVVRIQGHNADGVGVNWKNEKAERWEQSEPYEKTLVELMTTIARGDIPPGYRIRDFRANDESPLCQQRGLSFNFTSGQVITGSEFVVYVGTATNTAGQPLEFVETNCASMEVASVSAWPDVYLAPNQMTEVYVVDKVQEKTRRLQRRRSLIEGAY